MEMLSLEKELKENSYPGRGIVIGRSADGKKAVTAYFIMGRSENSRNRVLTGRLWGGVCVTSFPAMQRLPSEAV